MLCLRLLLRVRSLGALLILLGPPSAFLFFKRFFCVVERGNAIIKKRNILGAHLTSLQRYILTIVQLSFYVLQSCFSILQNPNVSRFVCDAAAH